MSFHWKNIRPSRAAQSLPRGLLLLEKVFIIVLLLLLSACSQDGKIATIPNAENIFFTSNHRLFISGDKNLYEIIKDNGVYERRLVSSKDCRFMGMAELDGWVFVGCNAIPRTNHKLYAFSVDWQPQDELIPLTDLEGLFLPNGMTSIPTDNSLLIADENFFKPVPVTKVYIDTEGDIPEVQEINYDWINKSDGVGSTNGIAWVNNKLYASSLGSLYLVTTDSIGTPLSTQTLASRATIWDDITPYCDGVIVTDYLAGTVSYVNDTGEVIVETPMGTFKSPSAVARGDGELFSVDQLLVTEVGILIEGFTPFGNQLTVKSLADLGIPACSL